MDNRIFKKPYTHKRFASRRDYSQRKLLGAAPEILPDNLYSVSRILTQKGNTCTANTSVAIRESMIEGILFDPDRQWEATLDFMGVSEANGADLKIALAVCVKTGFFRQNQATPSDKADAYFFVRKRLGEDWFDAVKNRIYLLYQKYGKVVPLSIGVNWYRDWDFVPDGIIPDRGTNLLGGHDVKVAGFLKLNGADYIFLQNSWGINYGKNGLYYVSREVFNKWFDVYGAGYIVDDPNPMIRRWGFILALCQNLIALYQSLLFKLGHLISR